MYKIFEIEEEEKREQIIKGINDLTKFLETVRTIKRESKASFSE